jgi:hypothetical protein
MSAQLTVECYAGYKANQRPFAFFLGKRRLQVQKIVDQWYGPDHTYFKVMAEDDNTYILRYSEEEDRWELVFFNAGHYHGEISPGMRKDAFS